MLKTTFPKFQLPGSLFDQVSITAIALLTAGISLMLWRGDQTHLRVTHFSWEGEKVGINDKSFFLRFNQPVDPKSIEENLKIEPPLLGKVSWQGNNLVYTLQDTPIYGTNYQIKLNKVARRDHQGENPSFVKLFSTHNRALAYIGVTGEERGRLMLYDITDPKKPQKTILTAKDLLVRRFKIYPQGDKIIFAAQDPTSTTGELQIFTVTTGINFSANAPTERPGKLERLLNNQDYITLAFELSSDGKTLVLLRSNRQNAVDTGLWIINEGQPPRPLGIQGTTFIVSPNGKYLAVSQQGGVSLIPLTLDAGPSRFLEGFERPLAFSKDGKRLLLTQNNADYTRSLILREFDGSVEEISRKTYPILDCQFEPILEKNLYCLRLDLVKRQDDNLHEEPFLSVINLDTWQDQPLLALPNYRDVQMSLSADGAALIFDQVATTAAMSSNDLLTPSRQAITDGRVWLLTLPNPHSLTPQTVMPQELTAGFYPRWMP